MSIEAIIKHAQRKANEEALKAFKERGGQVKRIGKLTVADLEEIWKDNLPAGMKAKLKRQLEKQR